MPRPKTKKAFLELNESYFQDIETCVKNELKNNSNSRIPTTKLNVNVRDIIGHLHEWHLLFLTWYKIGMSNKKPGMPAEGYTWKTVPALNQHLWKNYQGLKLADVYSSFKKSHKKLIKIADSHSEEELFTKKKYKWTGTTSLASYMISATSSHYLWALKHFKGIK